MQGQDLMVPRSSLSIAGEGLWEPPPEADTGAGLCSQEPHRGLVPICLHLSQMLCSRAIILHSQFAIWAFGVLPTMSNSLMELSCSSWKK